jgi:hypothetical protein
MDIGRLLQVLGAIEAGDWVALRRLGGQLKALAERGLYHTSIETARKLGEELTRRSGPNEEV